MERSTSRILTTHAGSLPRPADLLEMARRPHDQAAYAARVRRAVADVVREQVEHGLDVIDDGEMSKPSFITYVTERLSGFTPSAEPGSLPWAGSKEVTAFPEFYAPMLRESPNAAAPRFACTGPITYVGQAQVQADIANLKAALAGVTAAEAFIPAISPSNVEGRQKNLYYKTDEEYLFAIAEAMHEEYRAIVDAGLPPADRRSAAGDVLHREPDLDGGRVPALGPGARGRAQPRAARHPARPRALPHLLQHQHGPARARHGAEGHRRRHPQGQRRRLLVRGRQPAPRPRVARVEGRRSCPRARCSFPASSRSRPCSSSTRSWSPIVSSALPPWWGARTSSPAPTAASRRSPDRRRSIPRSRGPSSRRWSRARGSPPSGSGADRSLGGPMTPGSLP